MTEAQAYDYRELAFDLYNNAEELLDELVAMRKRRKMTQAQLADAMNVTQGYVSQIENGKTSLTSLLTDYALEVGARIGYVVEPAETKPEGARHYIYKKMQYTVPAFTEWKDDSVTVGRATYKASVEMKGEADAEEVKRITLIPGKEHQQDISVVLSVAPKWSGQRPEVVSTVRQTEVAQ
ncbi:transcriptional regulator [Bifidobacterium callitrichos]|uniref:Transcriptional regulator n=1 Tax=Bifidobacterium callitrichos TaxID=762209 RepID=A0A2T3G9R7_9BIFI|nr:helix-turn-helix transcriptional regulator [Bifidobacterium callitrichos]PST46240.1 transcriptional regulator [Bifidobacterium callitrichos]